jgi:hypothetical protein
MWRTLQDTVDWTAWLKFCLLSLSSALGSPRKLELKSQKGPARYTLLIQFCRKASVPQPNQQTQRSKAVKRTGELPQAESDRLGPDLVVAHDDLAFTHSIFVQCFLPMRDLPKANNQHWEVTHGNASLAVEAGCLTDPRTPGHWEPQEVPAGPKARLLFAYINDFAIRHNTPTIDLGKSLRGFMERNGVPVGGPNGHELTKQLKNIAAARILFGIWGQSKVSTRQARIAETINFWIDRDPKQGTLWQPEMQLAPEYFQALAAHRVPLPFSALVKLQANPRAMDVFCWLVYRMRSVKVPVRIPYVALHPVFGGRIKLLKHFKIEFHTAVLAAHKFYTEARVEFKNEYLILYPSPLLIATEAPRSWNTL